MKHKEETKTIEKAETFEIQWPQELDVKPKFSVAVTPTRTAQVYEDFRQVTGWDEVLQKHVERPQQGWRVVYILNKTGATPRTDRHHGEHHHTLLDVRLAIANYSAANMPAKRTTTRNIEYQPDEE